MARAIRARRLPDAAPIGAINITPLIDVMLVLLVVIILSIPVATHKVPVDVLGGDDFSIVPPTLHKLAIDGKGALYWDGAPIADAALPAALAAMQKERKPELHLQADGEAPYYRFDETLAVVKRAGVTTLGFVGNESFREAVN